ncbi:MAG: NAD+ synthase [Betaproteobacteria bacterium]|nr:NAD+ synthase [Betaproteobacteria bacterium]NBT11390.1 NAD+ synthase [Betaproteobacteria bacterium]
MLKVALAQINPAVGDLQGNQAKLLQAAQQAHAQGVRLLVSPELSLCGYPPEDLLLRPGFMSACRTTLQQLAQELRRLPGLAVVVGHPHQLSGHDDDRTRSTHVPRRFNAASVLRDGVVELTYLKRELPNYQVFDERRYFASGHQAPPPAGAPGVFEVDGVRVGLLICEDAWFEEPAQAAVDAGAQLLCVLNASPFHLNKAQEREAAMAQCARRHGRPLVYAHLTGGQDEVVFDGASFALQADGTVAARAPSFQEAVTLLQVLEASPAQGPVAAPARPALALRGVVEPLPSLEAQAWQALVTGVRDYVGKNGFPGAIIGLSGGVDSALVLAVAVDALGPERVRAVMMPSPYTAEISWLDARDMAQRLGVRYDEISIAPTFESFKSALAPQFEGLAEDTTEENLQARIRGTLLMALSNKTGSIVLTTGNKSEMATGYCTLYGDMAGGFAVIKDVSKTLVWKLCEWRNRQPDAHGAAQEVIPTRIITRAPSAELRPNQVDQDSLPPYEVLDAILSRYMEEDQSVEDIVAAGFDRPTVQRVVRLISLNEYKRRQAPIGIRITHRSFGKDWRYPITSKFRA